MMGSANASDIEEDPSAADLDDDASGHDAGSRHSCTIHLLLTQHLPTIYSPFTHNSPSSTIRLTFHLSSGV